MEQVMIETRDRLKSCFPQGYFNIDGDFIAHRAGNRPFGDAYCNLRCCDCAADVVPAVIEGLSRDCCKTMPFKTADANTAYRAYMVAGVNQFLETSFSEREFCDIYNQLGNGTNHRLTLAFVDSGFDLHFLRNQKQERLISADKLLATLNSIEYRARSLEQCRGGNDVLHRLLPKLISEAVGLRIVTVRHCGECDYWQPYANDTGNGFCSLFSKTKSEKGYCDEAKANKETK